MKVVWLCHFANQEMKDHFKTPKLHEMSPWIGLLIGIFQYRLDIELHIVAPNIFTNRDCSFVKKGIHYHFYPLRLKLIPKKVNTLFKMSFGANYHFVQRKIVEIIDQIKPDIIHLHGAENPHYSSGILPLIDKYPILTTIQGFIRNSSVTNRDIRNKTKIEEEIIKKTKHFGIRTDDMSKIVLGINPSASLHFHNYPVAKPKVLKDNIGKDEPIDCLFFARVCKDKGIEDLLSAIAILKNENPEISLSVIGDTSNSYLSYLKKTCVDLKIENNVKFLGFIETQDEIYSHALKAKMCVLPTHHDIIPGTIIESMYMKLPVVAYAVGGIPELNLKETTLSLVEKHNINQLAERICQLLKNVELRKTLSEKAYVIANERFNNIVMPNILRAYQDVLKSENKG
jgi:glycosyltransferase involved in cell wall biosynthesis